MFSALLTENDVQKVFDLTTSEPVLFDKTLGSVLQAALSQRFPSLGGNRIAEDQQWHERKTHVMRSLHLISTSFRLPEGRNHMSPVMLEVVVILIIRF
jgi:hypothetical protein